MGTYRVFFILCIFAFGITRAAEGGVRPIILVHGGAGDIDDSRVQGKLDGIRVAVRAGYEVLINGGSAVDAVEAAIITMELDEEFNAGYGAALNIRGEVAMDASIMNGEDLNAGAVTLVKDFPHPISIARKVLEDSPHAFLGGEGVKLFALEKGFETVDPESLVTENAAAALKAFLENDNNRSEVGVEPGVGTVGAVAIDINGHIAAGTSTGGTTGKAVGRIGDSPLIGSGTYADDNVGGVSSTGHGESILKYCMAHTIIKHMENGMDANSASVFAVNAVTNRFNNTAGVITLSKTGDVGVYFTSRRMSWAYATDDKIFYGIEHDIVFEDDYY